MISIKNHSSVEVREGIAPQEAGNKRSERNRGFVYGSLNIQPVFQSQTDCRRGGFPVENVCLTGNRCDDERFLRWI